MEVVQVFNNELSSLYEVKPPISKAKMTQITKSAIKGIKFYKHIVQSVEKFIQKCRPEYKVPGLYVVDSIVRQSRHQFGADKDVFGPRFVKNINNTFQHLFKCNPDDRSRIIRVLNLWQKNAVFPIEIIQPLLDMGHPNSSADWPNDSQTEVKEHKSVNDERSVDSQNWKAWPNDESRPYAEMSTKNLEKFMKAEMSSAIEEDRFRNQGKLEEAVKFNKKLLDFDYGDEDEEEMPQTEDNLQSTPNALALSISQNLLSNPDLLRQLQQLSSIQQHGTEEPSQPPPDKDDRILPPQDLDERSLAAVMARPPIVSEGGDRDERVVMPDLPRDLDERSLSAILAPIERGILPPLPFNDVSYQNSGYQQQQPPAMRGDEDERMMYSMPGEPPLPPPQDFDERIMSEDRTKERSRSRSGSRSRSRRQRSRSPRRRRSDSRSRRSSRSEGRERIQEKEKERERERERRKRGLPPIKKGCVSVCSTTLWLGHVPKSCTESDINAVFGEFGTVLSIDMIPPRGCAFVVMDRRQDASKAVLKLKNLKLQSSLVKMAWAPGKGVKGKEYKEYWDVNAGVSYIPCEKIPESSEALDLLEEGGFIDEESLPDNLKELRNQTEVKAIKPYGVPPILPPPAAVNLPGMVLPHLMQPQFGLPLSGLLPPQAMVMQMPMSMPPPNPMLMQSQALMNTIGMPPMIPPPLQNFKNDAAIHSPATPTEEDAVSSSAPQKSQFNPLLPPPPVSSAPIPYPPPPAVGFSFPPPGMPHFPWATQQKPPFGENAKQEEGSSSPMHHDMVISTDDESSVDRDFPAKSESKNASEFQRIQYRPPFPPFSPSRPRGPLEMPVGPRMRMPLMEGRDWYPRDFDNPSRDCRFDRPRESYGETDGKRPVLNREERHSFSERRASRNYRDDNRPTNMQDNNKSTNVQEENRSTNVQEVKNEKSKDKRKTDKKQNKSLMDDMLKLRFYQRDKNPSYASHLSKKLETKKKETVAKVKEEPSGKDTRKRSRWGRTLSEEREIQDQRRFEIEIKFQSYEQSSKAECSNSVEPSCDTRRSTDCSATDSSVSEAIETQNSDEIPSSAADS